MEKRSLFNIVGVLGGIFCLSSVSAAWSFDTLFRQWDSAGIFYYILPFLLVFALLFGILSKITILGDNKAVHAIIAAAIGLMSVITPFFPNFLRAMSSDLAVGISILLVAIILMGLFYDSEHKWIIYILFGIGALAFIFIAADTLSGVPGTGFNIWDDYGPAIITFLILAGIIWAIVAGSKKATGK